MGFKQIISRVGGFWLWRLYKPHDSYCYMDYATLGTQVFEMWHWMQAPWRRYPYL